MKVLRAFVYIKPDRLGNFKRLKMLQQRAPIATATATHAQRYVVEEARVLDAALEYVQRQRQLEDEFARAVTRRTPPAAQPHGVVRLKTVVKPATTPTPKPATTPKPTKPPAAPSKPTPTQPQECIACFERRHQMVAMRPCGHRDFCAACARDWFTKRTDCPTCRTRVEGLSIYLTGATRHPSHSNGAANAK